MIFRRVRLTAAAQIECIDRSVERNSRSTLVPTPPILVDPRPAASPLPALVALSSQPAPLNRGRKRSGGELFVGQGRKRDQPCRPGHCGNDEHPREPCVLPSALGTSVLPRMRQDASPPRRSVLGPPRLFTTAPRDLLVELVEIAVEDHLTREVTRELGRLALAHHQAS
jgi:hypothetical protein